MLFTNIITLIKWFFLIKIVISINSYFFSDMDNIFSCTNIIAFLVIYIDILLI